MTTLIFDLETDGFLSKMTRIHLICTHNPDTGETWVYRHNDEHNTIEEGVRQLMSADRIVGHNSISFDVPAIQKIYPDFKPPGECLDTLVLARVTFPDMKNRDFTSWRNGVMPSKLVGSHSLEAWGVRLGMNKGDYKATMEARGINPWAAWNQSMEDYCVNDVAITALLWKLCQQNALPRKCSDLEHDIHRIASNMERNGFPFAMAEAKKLAQTLETEAETLRQELALKYGEKAVPVKKVHVRPAWEAPTDNPKQYAVPRGEWGEDLSRPWWGEITFPKRSQVRLGAQYTVGAPYCKMRWQEFNPGSRQQIVERLVEEGWVPTEFTDSGAPSTEDAVLKKLTETLPVAKDISEFLFVQKLLGQVVTGPNSWFAAYREETGCIHGYTNTGGAVTGRCTHSSPNLSQVPGVLVQDVMRDGKLNPKFLAPDGSIYPHCYKPDGQLKKKAPLLGRVGEFGWECRSLFHVPEGWVQCGTDLSGIELRALAHLTAEFDGGELAEVVINGDPHQYNMDKTGIPSRDIVKRVLYGLLYGAGDLKLGLTANPLLSISEAKALGASLRAKLMAGLPALRRALQKIKQEASRGFLIGLDGRRLSVRSEHSALNTRLQSDAALIAKKWVCLTEERALARGWFHGWKDGEYLGSFVFLGFFHDELQAAVDPDIAEEFAAICRQAATDAGAYFGFRCRIDAESKIGRNWAECH